MAGRRSARATSTHDGTTDVLWREDATGNTAAWLMKDGGPSTTPTYFNTAGWNLIATADLDGNGTTDMLWQQGNQVAAWFMNTDGTVGNHTIIGDGSGWTAIGTGDFNGDGNADVLWQNNSNGTVAAWLMGTDDTVNTAKVYQSAAGWNLVASGDFNHDGTTDLMWQDGSGHTALWLMDPGTGNLALGRGLRPGRRRACGDHGRLQRRRRHRRSVGGRRRQHRRLAIFPPHRTRLPDRVRLVSTPGRVVGAQASGPALAPGRGGPSLQPLLIIGS